MKTNFKRLLAVVLSALLLVSSFAVVAFADDAVTSAPAATNLATSATVFADGVETTVLNDGDIETFYASEEAIEVGYHQYGNEVVLTLAERSFVSEVVISAYNWAAKNAAITYKVYVLDGEEWIYVATAAAPATSDEVAASVATFDAVMADAVKVVAEAVGYRWMPQINEIEIYAKSLGNDGFDDVADDDWYAAAVAYVRVNGLMTGIDEVNFAPASYFTYAMMAQVLYNLAGAPEVETAPTFADVDPEGWYADAIAWAEANGIAAGNADGSFTPDNAITRADIALYLYNYSRYLKLYTVDRADLSAFADAADASAAMKWAVAVGLFEGRSETELAADATATRAEVATILMRYCELDLAPNTFRNVAAHATASASSVRGSANGPEKAVDGADGTYWQPISEKDADGNFTGVATWNLKLDEAFDISRLVLTVASYKTWAKGVDYKVEALVDGSWKTIATFNDGDAFSATSKATFNIVLDAAVAATELKITCTNADAAEAAFVKAAIYEIQIIAAEAGMLEAPSVVYDNNAADAKVSASSSANANNLPANAVDADPKTAWTSLAEKDADGKYNGANLVLDWGYTQHIASIELLVANYSNWGLEAGVDYVVELRMNGKWVEVYSFNDADLGDNKPASVSYKVEFNGLLSADAVRVTGYNYTGSVKPKVFDINVTCWDKYVIDYSDVTSLVFDAATASASNFKNQWGAGVASLFDGKLDTRDNMIPGTEVLVGLVDITAADVIGIYTLNNAKDIPGYWGTANDLVFKVELLVGEEWVEFATYTQSEAITTLDYTVWNYISLEGADASATQAKITVVDCCTNWHSDLYEISAFVTAPVFYFE